MSRPLALFVVYALVFLAIDAIWLTLTAKPLYRRELGDLMLDQPNFVAAGLFYLIYITGLVVLVGLPAGDDVMRALWTGAVLGLMAYATYDLTNLATLRGFSPRLVLIDIAWGTTLTGVTAAVGLWIASRFS